MGRRAREPNEALAAELRDFMQVHDVSQNALAALLDVDKGTISRSLSTGRFSSSFRRKASKLLPPSGRGEDQGLLLQESLRLSAESANLLEAARALMALALDLAERKH